MRMRKLAGLICVVALSAGTVQAQAQSRLLGGGVRGATSCSGLADAGPFCNQTNAANLTGTVSPGQLPNPSVGALGGVESLGPTSHQFLNAISTSGVPSAAQPVASDVSGLAASATTDTTNASNISSGTLPAGRLPALSGDTTTAAGSTVTTTVKVNGNTPGNTCINQFTRSIDSSARGTCATVRASDADSSIAQTANNLSDLSSASAARTNLGLGSAATAPLPVLGAPGSFSTLEQWVPQTLPTVSANLNCTGTSGNYPINDNYLGALSGANVTYTLPTSGCADGSVITIDAIQDGSHTIAVQTSAAGGIVGAQTFLIGSSAGNSQELQYQFCSGRCGAALNQNAWVLRSDIVYPSQVWPVQAGGTGLGTLTQYAVYAGNGTAAPAAIGPDATTNQPLLSAGSAANPAFGALPLGNSNSVSGQLGTGSGGTGTASPQPVNAQFKTSGTSYTVPAGTTLLEVFICGAGGGGSGTTIGGSVACSAAAGGSGACGRYWIFGPTGSYTYSLGTAGTAGSNGASPTAGTAGGGSSITIAGVTATEGGGGISASGGSPTGTNNAACTSAPSGGVAGLGASGNLGIASNVSRIAGTGGTAGQAGAAQSTATKGGSTGNSGGNGGNVNASGVSVNAPTAGNQGYALFLAYGAF